MLVEVVGAVVVWSAGRVVVGVGSLSGGGRLIEHKISNCLSVLTLR